MTTVKYRFRIRTRQGLLIERLSIHGRDEADAARKLRQMYQHCEILSTATQSGRPAGPPSVPLFLTPLGQHSRAD
jgi:hypothetical protein